MDWGRRDVSPLRVLLKLSSVMAEGDWDEMEVLCAVTEHLVCVLGDLLQSTTDSTYACAGTQYIETTLDVPVKSW